jgi:hypothetical protein
MVVRGLSVGLAMRRTFAPKLFFGLLAGLALCWCSAC